MTYDEYLDLLYSINRIIRDYDIRRFDYDTGKVALPPSLDEHLRMIDQELRLYMEVNE